MVYDIIIKKTHGQITEQLLDKYRSQFESKLDELYKNHPEIQLKNVYIVHDHIFMLFTEFYAPIHNNSDNYLKITAKWRCNYNSYSTLVHIHDIKFIPNNVICLDGHWYLTSESETVYNIAIKYNHSSVVADILTNELTKKNNIIDKLNHENDMKKETINYQTVQIENYQEKNQDQNYLIKMIYTSGALNVALISPWVWNGIRYIFNSLFQKI